MFGVLVQCGLLDPLLFSLTVNKPLGLPLLLFDLWANAYAQAQPTVTKIQKEVIPYPSNSNTTNLHLIYIYEEVVPETESRSTFLPLQANLPAKQWPLEAGSS